VPKYHFPIGYILSCQIKFQKPLLKLDGSLSVGVVMAEDTVKHYLGLNRKYLTEGEALLAKGDHVQASEKFWGATAEMVKTVAASRGLELRTHNDLWTFITKLRDELKDPEVTRLFGLANTLHQNFYEASMTPEAVGDHVEAVKQLIHKLENLISP